MGGKNGYDTPRVYGGGLPPTHRLGTTGLQELLGVRPGCFRRQSAPTFCSSKRSPFAFAVLAMLAISLSGPRRRWTRDACSWWSLQLKSPKYTKRHLKTLKVTKITKITKNAAWRHTFPLRPAYWQVLAGRVAEGTAEPSTEQLQMSATSTSGTIVASNQP